VRAALPNFRAEVCNNIVLQVVERARVDFVLEVGVLQLEIIVEESLPRLRLNASSTYPEWPPLHRSAIQLPNADITNRTASVARCGRALRSSNSARKRLRSTSTARPVVVRVTRP
jgi:hypothetical protein